MADLKIPSGSASNCLARSSVRYEDIVRGRPKPCIGAEVIGSGSCAFYVPQIDVTGAAIPAEGPLNIGAYQGTPTEHVVHCQVENSGLVESSVAMCTDGGTVTFKAIDVRNAGFEGFFTNGVLVSASKEVVIPNVRDSIDMTAHFSPPPQGGLRVGENEICKTIQEAIDLAVDGERILVEPGVYDPIDTGTKCIEIVATGSREETVIDGQGKRRCANLGEEYGRGSTMTGFTLRNGYITAFLSTEGGAGVRFGTISNCSVTTCSNTLANVNGHCYSGGTCYTDVFDSTITNCFVRCGGYSYGGGCYGGKIERSKIVNNAVYGRGDTRGSGTYLSDTKNCLITGNFCSVAEFNAYATPEFAQASATYGGTHYQSTFCDNPSKNGDDTVLIGSVYSATLYNCIASGVDSVWYHDVYQCNLNMCLIGGDPLFVNREVGDYRLHERSPAVGAGDPKWAVQSGDRDLLGNPRMKNGEVSLGCYEGGVCAVVVGVSGRGAVAQTVVCPDAAGNVTLTAEEADRPFVRWMDANGKVLGTDKTLVLPYAGLTSEVTAEFEIRHWAANDNATLRAAIEASEDTDVIDVAAGVYEPIVVPAKEISIIGAGAGLTIIDGGNTNVCARLGDEDRTVTLQGVTLRNGWTRTWVEAGGVMYGHLIACTIVDCSGDGEGGAYGAVLESCLITRCGGNGNGSAARATDTYNCTVINNRQTGPNGWMVYSHGLHCNDLILDNFRQNGSPETTICSDGWMVNCVTNRSEGLKLTDLEGGDYRPLPGSSLIDASDHSCYIPKVDLRGNPRVSGRAADIGAYEYLNPVSEQTDETGKVVGTAVSTDIIVNTNGTTSANVVITTEQNCFVNDGSAKPVSVTAAGMGTVTFDTEMVKKIGEKIDQNQSMNVDATVKINIENMTGSMNPEVDPYSLNASAALVMKVNATIGANGTVDFGASAADTKLVLTDVGDRTPVVYRSEGTRRVRIPSEFNRATGELTFRIGQFNVAYSVEYTDRIIESTADWTAFAASVNGGDSYVNKLVALVASIDFQDATAASVGTAEHPFGGIFQGNGEKVLNYSLSGGLFGETENAVIHGLKLRPKTVAGSDVGALVGTARGYLWLKGVAVLGGEVVGTETAGGLVGRLVETGTKGAAFENCFVAAKVGARNAGGFVGLVSSDNAEFSHLLFDGEVNGSSSAAGIVGTRETSKTLKFTSDVVLGLVASSGTQSYGIVGGTQYNYYPSITKSFVAVSSNKYDFAYSSSLSQSYKARGADYFTSGGSSATAAQVAAAVGEPTAVASGRLLAFSAAGETRRYPADVKLTIADFLTDVQENAGRIDGLDYQGYANYRDGKLVITWTEDDLPCTVINGVAQFKIFSELTSVRLENVVFEFKPKPGSVATSGTLVFDNAGTTTIRDCDFDNTSILLTGGKDMTPSTVVVSGSSFANVPGWAIQTTVAKELLVQVNVFKNIGGAIFAEGVSDKVEVRGNHLEESFTPGGNGDNILNVSATVGAALVIWEDNALPEGQNVSLRVPVHPSAPNENWAEVSQGGEFIGFYPIKHARTTPYVNVPSSGSGAFECSYAQNVKVDSENRFESGVFTQDPSALVAAGSKVTTEGSSYRVSRYLAKLTGGDEDKYFDTLSAALAAAASGERIVQQVSCDEALELPTYSAAHDVAFILPRGVSNGAITSGGNTVVEKVRQDDGSLVCQAVAVTEKVTLNGLADKDGVKRSLDFSTEWMLKHGVSPRILADTTKVEANGLPVWESYVLGLEPTDPNSTVKVSFVRKDDKWKIEVVGINSELVVPQYTLWATDSLDTEFTPVGEPRSSAEFSDLKDTSPSRFYKVKIDISWK